MARGREKKFASADSARGSPPPADSVISCNRKIQAKHSRNMTMASSTTADDGLTATPRAARFLFSTNTRISARLHHPPLIGGVVGT